MPSHGTATPEEPAGYQAGSPAGILASLEGGRHLIHDNWGLDVDGQNSKENKIVRRATPKTIHCLQPTTAACTTHLPPGDPILVTYCLCLPYGIHPSIHAFTHSFSCHSCSFNQGFN